MGWYMSPVLHEPHTCEGTCKHTDCTAHRTLVTSLCQHCQKPIGENERIYFVDGGSLTAVHAVCEEELAR